MHPSAPFKSRSTLVVSLALAAGLTACKGKDASADGAEAKPADSAAATGENKDEGKVAPPAAGPADPALVAAAKTELDKVGACKLGGQPAELEEPVTSVSLKVFEHEGPAECADPENAWNTLVDAHFEDDAKAAKFKPALIASLQHDAPAARFVTIEALLDLPEAAKLTAADYAVISPLADAEQDPAVASLYGELVGEADLEDAEMTKVVAALVGKTKNHALVGSLRDTFTCNKPVCAPALEAWAKNGEPAVRAAGLEVAADMPEDVITDAALCKMSADALTDPDANMVAFAARLLLETGDPCKAEHPKLFVALDKVKSDAEGHASVFFEIWNNDPGDYTAEQNKALVDAAKAVKASGTKNPDFSSAADDCIAAAAG